jgi:hypothetical protein
MPCLSQLPQTEAQYISKPWLSKMRSYYIQQSGFHSWVLQSSVLHHNNCDLTGPPGQQRLFPRGVKLTTYIHIELPKRLHEAIPASLY